MRDAFEQDIHDIITYYDNRSEMFCQIESAIECFKNNKEQQMWVHLIEYGMLKEFTKELFDGFTYDTLSLLLGAFGANLVIVGTPHE